MMNLQQALASDAAVASQIAEYPARVANTADGQYSAVLVDGALSVKVWTRMPDGVRIGVFLTEITPEILELDWRPFQYAAGWQPHRAVRPLVLH
jgi:hypothetical protein